MNLGQFGLPSGVLREAKIPYLKELGINCIELLPIYEYDEFEHSKTNPETGEVLVGNYWGYSTVGYFAPHGPYSASGDRGQQVNEFKGLVKALHEAGIEVILDVVYNHTCEGDDSWPTYSYRGIDNSSYYLLEKDKIRYRNDAGTGNVTLTAVSTTVATASATAKATGDLGVGASFAINVSDNLTEAKIDNNATLTGGADATLSATGDHTATTTASGGAGKTSGSAIGGDGLGMFCQC